MKQALDWCCIAAVNDEGVFNSNLAISPMIIADPTRLVTLRNQPCASAAYNTGLDQTDAEICIFAHQDVYLPAGWDQRVADQLAKLEKVDPAWAVAGLYGINHEAEHTGRVWSSGIGREIGIPLLSPVRAQSLDELVLILKRSSGLRFDPELPHFHLYGTDIAQSALAAGFSAYVIDAPVVHNSTPVTGLKGGFLMAYNYMRRKWRGRLPIRTPVTRITSLGLKIRWQILRWNGVLRCRRAPKSQANDNSRPDPVRIARRQGYE